MEHMRIVNKSDVSEHYCSAHNVDCQLHGERDVKVINVNPNKHPSSWVCPTAVKEMLELFSSDVPSELEQLIDDNNGYHDTDLPSWSVEGIVRAFNLALQNEDFNSHEARNSTRQLKTQFNEGKVNPDALAEADMWLERYGEETNLSTSELALVRDNIQVEWEEATGENWSY